MKMMFEQFTSYSTKLERLSNDELHRSAEKLVLAEHNGLEAERVYGPAFIQRKIDERRKARSP